MGDVVYSLLRPKKRYVIWYGMFEDQWVSDMGRDTNWLWLAKLRCWVYKKQGYNSKVTDNGEDRV